jgi:hypothetical protein
VRGQRANRPEGARLVELHEQVLAIGNDQDDKDHGDPAGHKEHALHVRPAPRQSICYTHWACMHKIFALQPSDAHAPIQVGSHPEVGHGVL